MKKIILALFVNCNLNFPAQNFNVISTGVVKTSLPRPCCLSLFVERGVRVNNDEVHAKQGRGYHLGSLFGNLRNMLHSCMHPNGAILNEILRKENACLNQGWNLTNEQYIEWSTSMYKCDSQGFEEDTDIHTYIYI